MPNESSDPESEAAKLPTQFFRIQRAQQISDSHCGPAVIQMLLSNVGETVTQPQIAAAGGAENYIEMHGMRVDQLAEAVKALSPSAEFWYKDHATVDDLAALVLEYKYPVGIEWQGIFDDEGDELDDPEPDYGHYSVITHIDREKGELIIVDPYKHYVSQDRIFEIDFFVSRWIDWNEVTNPETGTAHYAEDFHMMFIVTPNGETFPAEIGMRRA